MPNKWNPIPVDIGDWLGYDPVSGVLTWKIRPGLRVKIGDVAGNLDKSDGYIKVKFRGKRYRAHRICYFIFTGIDPGESEIDHRNRVKTDNRFANIKLTDRIGNMTNLGMYRNNKSGFRGVSRLGKKWRATRTLGGLDFYLGVFDTPELASQAYEDHRAKYPTIGDLRR